MAVAAADAAAADAHKTTKGTYNHAGTDLKSVLLNLSSIGFICLPIVWYYFYRIQVVVHAKEGFALGVVLLYAVAYLVPPTGWRRPHPYSDDPRNVPAGRKQN